MDKYMTQCPMCKGSIHPGKTVFTAKIGTGILLIEDVPAEICSLCGEKWLSDETMNRVELIADGVRDRHVKFEIIVFNAA